MPIVILVRAVLLMSTLLMMQDVRPTDRSMPSKRESMSLRDEVREIIRPRCGSCHTSTLPTAKPKAVAVFDLARDDWPRTMSVARLGKFEGRLSSLDDSLKSLVKQFVRDETARRNAPGS
jgi:hypothetical protein